MRVWLVLLMVLAASLGARADEDRLLSIDLLLSEAAPYRIEAMPGDWRLQVWVRETATPVKWPEAGNDPRILGLDRRASGDGWQILTFDLAQAYGLVAAHLNGSRALRITMRPQDGGQPLKLTGDQLAGQKPLIVLDPGHGGLDSGAVREDHEEAELMLTFAQELAEELTRTGRLRVQLTRSDDVFMLLSERIAVATGAGASAFISLHADALVEGKARGAAVFTLSDKATSVAAAELVEAHNRADAMIGGAIEGADDEISTVLIDLAQRTTGPQSRALAAALVSALADSENQLRKQAQQSADFGVLKSPDIPSILLELGFMSDEADLANLVDPDWRQATARAVRDGILNWVDARALASPGQ